MTDAEEKFAQNFCTRLERLLNESPFKDAGREFKQSGRALAQAMLGQMDIVSREEFDAHAKMLADAVARATDSRFEIDTLPEDFDATALPDPHVMTASMGIEGFLDLFGKPDRETACECERKTEMSLPQALSLLNGSVIADAIADPEGRVANLVLGGLDNEELIAELYLAAIGRLPTGDEAELAEGHFESSASRTAAAQDLMWALLNSNAFLFNS